MKIAIALLALVAGIKGFAMTDTQIGECMFNQNEFTGTFISIVQDEAREGRITKADYEKFVVALQSDSVQTCRQAAGLAAETAGKILRTVPVVPKKK